MNLESVDSNSDNPESRKIEEIKTEITNKKSEHQEQSNYVESKLYMLYNIALTVVSKLIENKYAY